jgi:hypothetical protein
MAAAATLDKAKARAFLEIEVAADEAFGDD